MLTLASAVWQHKPNTKMLIHSDQGAKFTNMNWASFLKHHDLGHSINRHGTGKIILKKKAFSTHSHESPQYGGLNVRTKRHGTMCSLTFEYSITQEGNIRKPKSLRNPGKFNFPIFQ